MSNTNGLTPKYKPASRGPDFSKPGGPSQKLPWFTSWRELWLVSFLGIPFLLLIGAHVAGFAMLIRRWFRIPYLLTMLILYLLLMLPLWLNATYGFSPPAIATGIILLSLCPIAMAGKQEILEGGNFEESAPAHILLILAYMLLPAMYISWDRRSEAISGVHCSACSISIVT